MRLSINTMVRPFKRNIKFVHGSFFYGVFLLVCVSVDDHRNESSLAVLSQGNICFVLFSSNF